MNEPEWLLHNRPIMYFSFNLKTMPSVLEVMSSEKKSPRSDHFSYQYVNSIQIFFTTDQFELKADEKFKRKLFWYRDII